MGGLISPGRSCCDPPPTRPMVDEVWCGARNGAVRTRPPDAEARPPQSGPSWWRAPAHGRALAAGRASAGRASSCRCPANRRGAGDDRRPPTPRGRAAGTGWPRTSARSATGSATGGWGGSTWSRVRAPARHSTTARRSGAVCAAPLATTRASTMLSGAGTTSACPSESTIGATPGTGRSAPSRPSSARKANRATASIGTWPSEASTPMAMARSSPAPDLRTPLGARFTTIGLSGHDSSLDITAARAPSRATRGGPASGCPTSR